MAATETVTPLYTPTKTNPLYTCVVVTRDRAKYDLSKVLLRLEIENRKNQLAGRAQVKCVNAKCGSKYLNGLIHVNDRLFLYAHDGETTAEVFRGVVWTVSYHSALKKELTFLCYDNLIYLQESEDNRYFPSGRSSKDICEAICKDWGIPLSYSYASITHGKLPLNGRLSDILLTQILDEVKKQVGKRYVVRSVKDTIQIAEAEQNTTVYELSSQGAVLETSSNVTLEDVITKVVILGKADDDGQSKVETTVLGDTDQYGTLQKIQTKAEDTSLADARQEAEQLIKDKGKPVTSYEVEAVDIPWVQLGDKIKIAAGNLFGMYVIVGIAHDISDTEKTMQLTLEDITDTTKEATANE